VYTLKNITQLFPSARDFNAFTAKFQDEATEKAIWFEISSDKWNHDVGIFSTVYPNLNKHKMQLKLAFAFTLESAMCPIAGSSL